MLVAKVDRISRDVEHIAGLMKRATLKVAPMPHADNFQLHLFAALAQQEREFIAGRTKDTLAALKRDADSGKTESIKKVANCAATLRRGRTDQNRAKARQSLVTHASPPRYAVVRPKLWCAMTPTTAKACF
ncbi:recombinase family protein [Pseudomonas massiliensis]|uniref:recombinase family protein n=1 Tax=Pseudomonas massiliensis TaxID=522492 RepID=UPI002D77EA6A|nr:recombinase family protein [Pseudomonas massiliensis]